MKCFTKTISTVLAVSMLLSGASLFAAGTDPVEKTFSYAGDTIAASSYDGYTLIEYPESIAEGDVEAFLSYEVEQHPADAALVSYSFPGQAVRKKPGRHPGFPENLIPYCGCLPI